MSEVWDVTRFDADDSALEVVVAADLLGVRVGPKTPIFHKMSVLVRALAIVSLARV